ncbi:MAG TPA: hypothetical protein VGP80_00905 [Gemmatimonadales bacterium]|jgi:hypothetical protein|nr:hypothetical protein [Gemmatimonadales bacterium]
MNQGDRGRPGSIAMAGLIFAALTALSLDLRTRSAQCPAQPRGAR